MIGTLLLHCDRARFDLAYRLFWRLGRQPRLLDNRADADVACAHDMERAVSRDRHKMRAFVRFRRTATEGREHYVAWFEPAHHIVAENAPFFARRFSSMTWSILTPDLSAHWDGGLLAEAPQRAAEMISRGPTRPRVERAEMPRAMAADEAAHPMSLAELARDLAGCKRCPLYEKATQAVAGEGPAKARLMFVGEQPGDEEDLEGRPFIGPAGRVLDAAFKRAGIDRAAVFVTNAVKHFKYLPRDKRRLHKRPDAWEIDRCRWWIAREIGLVQPQLIVSLGATAAQSLLDRPVAVTRERGVVRPLSATSSLMITVHPSYLLRIRDETENRSEWKRFLADLRAAKDYLQHG